MEKQEKVLMGRKELGWWPSMRIVEAEEITLREGADEEWQALIC